MLYEFLTVSGAFFWIILAGIVLLEMRLLSKEGAVEATFIAVVTFFAAWFFTDAFYGLSWLHLLFAVALYFLLGACWSIKQWYSFLVARRAEVRASWEKKPADKRDEWPKFASNNRPTARDNKDKLIGWMALWPFSVSWWLLTWPRHVFVRIYEWLTTIYDRMSANVFR